MSLTLPCIPVLGNTETATFLFNLPALLSERAPPLRSRLPPFRAYSVTPKPSSEFSHFSGQVGSSKYSSSFKIVDLGELQKIQPVRLVPPLV